MKFSLMVSAISGSVVMLLTASTNDCVTAPRRETGSALATWSWVSIANSDSELVEALVQDFHVGNHRLVLRFQIVPNVLRKLQIARRRDEGSQLLHVVRDVCEFGLQTIHESGFVIDEKLVSKLIAEQ